jgi:hypothetical protein
MSEQHWLFDCDALGGIRQNYASTIERYPSLPELMAVAYDSSPAMAASLSAVAIGKALGPSSRPINLPTHLTHAIYPRRKYRCPRHLPTPLIYPRTQLTHAAILPTQLTPASYPRAILQYHADCPRGQRIQPRPRNQRRPRGGNALWAKILPTQLMHYPRVIHVSNAPEGAWVMGGYPRGDTGGRIHSD